MKAKHEEQIIPVFNFLPLISTLNSLARIHDPNYFGTLRILKAVRETRPKPF